MIFLIIGIIIAMVMFERMNTLSSRMPKPVERYRVRENWYHGIWIKESEIVGYIFECGYEGTATIGRYLDAFANNRYLDGYISCSTEKRPLHIPFDVILKGVYLVAEKNNPIIEVICHNSKRVFEFDKTTKTSVLLTKGDKISVRIKKDSSIKPFVFLGFDDLRRRNEI